jgi:malate permease and related proteins
VNVLSVFVDVVVPVFAVAALGYLLGPRLGLEARTLARVAYHVFVPAFTFRVISRSDLPFGRTLRMAACIVVMHAVFAAMGWGAARLLRRSREGTAAFVMVTVFGNVGNFALALLQFRLGERALVPATLYFVVSLIVSFVVCVGAAAWARGGRASAVLQVLRTPALLAVLPAALVSATGAQVPLPLARAVGLLGDAMIPVMLFLLGVQLAGAKALRLSADVLVASALRLIGCPLVAALLVVPFGVTGIERTACILQAAMPAAVLVAIISAEYDVEPAFVMSSIFYSTALSLPVLTVLLALL